MTWPRWVLVVYGIVNILMGLQAFLFPSTGKASFMSLAGGVGAGMLVLMAVWVSLKNPRGGYIMALAICALLLLQFGRGMITDAMTGKALVVYPKLVSVVMALGVAGLLGYGHFQARAAKSAEPSQTG